MERQAEALASAARLTEACALEKTELVRDAVIQRFEFTFEAVWKALKVYLVRQGYVRWFHLAVHDEGRPRRVPFSTLFRWRREAVPKP